MSFETLSLADIQLESNYTELATGTYTFELLPTAKVRTTKWGTQELSLSAAVAEGDSKGQRVFINFPDPDSLTQDGEKQSWSAQAMKKLQVVLGQDELPGENVVDYFNRVASSGLARFSAFYGPNPKKEGSKSKVVPFSFKPAA